MTDFLSKDLDEIQQLVLNGPEENIRLLLFAVLGRDLTKQTVRIRGTRHKLKPYDALKESIRNGLGPKE